MSFINIFALKPHQMTTRLCRTTSLPFLLTRNSTTASNTVLDDSEMAQAKPMHQIPGPKGLPFIGTLLQYARNDGWGFKNFFSITEKRRQQYGPIYKEKIGTLNILVVSKAEDVEKVLRAEGKYPDRSPVPPLVEYRKKRNLPLGVAFS